MRQELTRNHKGWSLDQVTITNSVSKFTKEEWKPNPVRTIKTKNKILYIFFLF